MTRESNTEYCIKQRKSDDVTSLHSFSLIYHAPCHADERYVQLVGIDHFDERLLLAKDLRPPGALHVAWRVHVK